MTLAAVPKWVWRSIALAVLLAAVATCSLHRAPPPPKPNTFITMQGDRLIYLGTRVIRETGQPPAFEVAIPLRSDASKDELHAAANKIFEAFAGPKADEMDFRRARVRPEDGSEGTGLFGFWIHVSVGPGDVDEEALRGAVAYDKGADGKWSSGGAEPGPPPHIDDYTLKSGARFVLTAAAEDFPRGYFVVECETCGADDAAHDIAANFYDVLRALSARATRDGLKEVTVHIFARPRRTVWDFPPRLNVGLKRDSKGEWRAPLLSTEKLETLIRDYAKDARSQGAKARGEAR